MSSGAKKIEITQSTLLKLLIRRGSDGERKNITLSEGELGYTVDTQRLFIGDGATIGAIPISLELYYGSTSPTAYTQAVLGDIVYDSTEGALYRLNAADPTVFGNWVPFLGAATARVDDQTLKKEAFNGVPNVLMVKTVSASQIDPQIAGLGIEFLGKTLQTKSAQTFDSINVRSTTALQLPTKLQFGTTGGATQYSLPPFDGPAGYSLVTNGQSVLDWAPGSIASQYLVLSGNQVPVGTILQYGSGGSIGSTASAYQVPYGYFLCDGRTLSSSNYGALYAAISTYYGSPSVGTFKIPSLSSSDTVFLIKYLADQFIQQLNVSLQVGLTGFNTTTNAVVTSFTYPVDNLTTVNVGINDYVSKTYVDDQFNSLNPTNSVYRLTEASEPNCGAVNNAAGYLMYIDTRDRQVRYHGYNSQGSCGVGPVRSSVINSISIPIEFDNVWEKPEHLYSTEGTTFVVTNSGNIYATGASGFGTTGTGSTADVYYYTKISLPPGSGKVIKVSVGGGYWGGGSNSFSGAKHVFALTDAGSAFGWGYNGFGQLAQSSPAYFSSPISMHTGLLSATRIKNIWSFAGSYYGHSFAIDIDNNVYCCGYNGYGALGLGDTTSRSAWVRLPGFTADAVYGAAASNQYQATFILSGGKVWGAGYNSAYNLGLNNNTAYYTTFRSVCADSTSGTQLQGVSSLSINDISSGTTTAVALMQDRTIKVWGYNAIGQCGIGTFGVTYVTAPTASFAGSFVNANIVKVQSYGLDKGTLFTLNSAGEIWSTGYNEWGVVGDTTTANKSIFTRARQPYNKLYKDFIVLGTIDAVYSSTVAAIDTNNNLYAWGNNGSNQLGSLSWPPVQYTTMPTKVFIN